ncbi:MAG: epoxyqueuosine reductase QueH [Lachnospiraceae bacterium]|nr:epoxyqueuosine reductase QueH [Lachnospiraceae bacterium]
MNKRNFRKEMEAIADMFRKSSENEGGSLKPRVLLHVCCAPCFSGSVESLLDWADVTAFFYNPNMNSEEEYDRRAAELRRYIKEADLPVKVIIKKFDASPYYRTVRGLENVPEGGIRCDKCFALRLRETALNAKENGFDYFATTLTVSPLKNAEKINLIGEIIGNDIGAAYLPSDFKKKDGFKHSIEQSEKYGLYRQDFCGCIYSMGDEVS